ncbi:hypothetical protein AB0C81_26830 [Streptomyces roseoverticillatus]|uniref:hypothetical protein n=1 Tax=Streptomyces roseoverticillatus TaxID=66429 RepID=UPI0033D4E6EC
MPESPSGIDENLGSTALSAGRALSTIDSEKRWSDARRLLHDDTLPTPDRVAGLLLVLYAQKIATISQLTADDVHLDNDTVAITFGTSPVVLPEPLAALVRELVVTRRGKAKIGTPEDVPWLFPGGRPGRPLGDDRIGQRLHKIGIRPGRTAPPHCSPSPPNYPPPSSPGYSASTSKSPSNGRRHQPATGPPTPPMSAVANQPRSPRDAPP